MPFLRATRTRSGPWPTLFACALLLVGAYVLFDILDVDGSQMPGWPADDILVASPLQVEANRPWRIDPATNSIVILPPGLAGRVGSDRSALPAHPSLVQIRQSRVLPRVNLYRDRTRPSASAEPA